MFIGCGILWFCEYATTKNDPAFAASSAWIFYRRTPRLPSQIPFSTMKPLQKRKERRVFTSASTTTITTKYKNPINQQGKSTCVLPLSSSQQTTHTPFTPAASISTIPSKTTLLKDTSTSTSSSQHAFESAVPQITKSVHGVTLCFAA